MTPEDFYLAVTLGLTALVTLKVAEHLIPSSISGGFDGFLAVVAFIWTVIGIGAAFALVLIASGAALS